MLQEIRRRFGATMPGDIFRRSHRYLPQIRPERYGDHVVFEELAKADTDIETRLDDIDDGIVDGEVERDLRIGLVEAPERRLDEGGGRKSRRMQTHRAARRVAEVPEVLDRRFHLRHCRPNALDQPRSGIRQRYAARRAIEKLHAETLFQFTNPLAERRGGNAKLARGAGEGAELHDGDEGPEVGEFAAAHLDSDYAVIPKECFQFIADSPQAISV